MESRQRALIIQEKKSRSFFLQRKSEVPCLLPHNFSLEALQETQDLEILKMSFSNMADLSDVT